MNCSSLNSAKVATSTGEDGSIGWNGRGTVWTSLEGLPSGNKTYQIPGTPQISTTAQTDDDDDEDDGLWSALMVTCDLDCKEVALAKSVVVPSQVLHENNYYKGNSKALVSIGVGKEYQCECSFEEGRVEYNTFGRTWL